MEDVTEKDESKTTAVPQTKCSERVQAELERRLKDLYAKRGDLRKAAAFNRQKMEQAQVDIEDVTGLIAEYERLIKGLRGGRD